MIQHSSNKPDSSGPTAPRLLTYPEAADYLRISERTLWSMVNDSQIKCVRVRHLVRFDRYELDRWIDEQQRSDG